MDHTNLSDTDILLFSIVKKGYCNLIEAKELDTPELLKILEYESIMSDIESLAIDDSRNES